MMAKFAITVRELAIRREQKNTLHTDCEVTRFTLTTH